jgi:hypothetical protein
MKAMSRYKILCLLMALFGMMTQSCKKDKSSVVPLPRIEFTVSSADTLVFEHSGTKDFEVSVSSVHQKDFVASFSDINAAFTLTEREQLISSNTARNFSFTFNQFGVQPGVYPSKLSVSVANENAESFEKNVMLVYRPNCAYEFRDYKNGEITYQINGILQNKTLTCSYNTSGKLSITGLTPYPVVLEINCDNKTVSMQPVIHNGATKTAQGSINMQQQIELSIFNDGAPDAVAVIKP